MPISISDPRSRAASSCCDRSLSDPRSKSFAIESHIKAFLRGSSVIVSAPTSSGKTLIAEASTLATLARGRRIFYTTPLKALSNQKLRDFRVGVTSSDGRLFPVDAIVLDEVHNLSDISHGTVWEGIVIYCPKEVQLICLSATVANSDELAGWIGQIHDTTELITSSKRPVPLCNSLGKMVYYVTSLFVTLTGSSDKRHLVTVTEKGHVSCYLVCFQSQRL